MMDELELKMQAMARFMDASDRLVEAVAGYKARFIARGFSEPIAEQMAAQMHATILANLLTNGKQAVPRNRQQRRAGN